MQCHSCLCVLLTAASEVDVLNNELYFFRPYLWDSPYSETHLIRHGLLDLSAS